jgi:hypothetical protein
MTEFPRTMVAGVSLPRLLIGSNWFLGYSHTSHAKDKFIKELQSRERIAKILAVFMEYGVDAVMYPLSPHMEQAIRDAEEQAGRPITRIITPGFNLLPGGPPEDEPPAVFDRCRELGATFCLPHQCVTDALLDRLHGHIRDIDNALSHNRS